MDANSAGGAEQDGSLCGAAEVLPKVRTLPLPVLSSSSVKSKYSTLSFKINGQTIPLRPEGGSTELRLTSSSGFTSISIPNHAPVAPPSLATISTPIISGGSTELRLTSPTGFTSIRIPNHAPVASPSPAASSAPIISDVVSGEEAQKVLTDHMVSVEAPPPTREHRTPHVDGVRLEMRGALRLLGEGDCSPAPPPACVSCCSQYRLIAELRGFLCMCSPLICQSLLTLKRKRKQKPWRQRKKNRTDKTPSDHSTVPPASSVCNSQAFFSSSPENLRTGPPLHVHSYTSPKALEAEPAEGKMVILLEDFYYGSAPGQITSQPSLENNSNIGPIRCSVCTETLSNNIRLMQHMQLHVAEDVSHSDLTCPHCLRQFLTADKLQSHVHEVHTCFNSTVTCRICELSFGSEPDLLCHMRTNHRPGEMPYTCQVCDFRSSSYWDVWFHFEQLHANTRNLLCQFCLRVLRSTACYQQHFAHHQRGCCLTCHRCRLHFLFVRDRLHHEAIHHKTHIKPAQLSGLKPGTKVTVRTYSVTTDSSKDADRPVPLSNQRPPKGKQVDSLQHLSAPGPVPQRCMECQSAVTDLSHHFPSVVQCWLCSFTTCCSNTYASHMINNHSHKVKSSTMYPTIFRPEPRLRHTIRCESCSLSTCRGDLMANHLAAWPEHTCTILTHTGSPLCEEEDTNALQDPNIRHTESVMSSGLGGAFVPVLLGSNCHSSPQLSIKALKSPPQSVPVMTINFLRPHPQPTQTVSQLELVLQALCRGVPQAAMRSQISPQTIQSMIEQLEQDLSDHSWNWWAEPLAEWVLSRREQQLVVSEDVLLQTARTALRRARYGPGSPETPGEWTPAELRACYTWTVNFLLTQEVGLQRITGTKLPQNVQERSHCFTQSLQAQIRTFPVPLSSVGFMDEFPLFLDLDSFHQDRLALQFCSSDQRRPLLDVVLCALSDGTLLPPMLFFTGPPPSLPKDFPKNVILLARPPGFTDRERLHFWIYKVWCPWMSTLTHDPSLLLMDTYRGHWDPHVRRTLSCMSTTVQFIPPSCSSVVQPLEVCMTPVLQVFLQSRWSRLVSEGGLEGLDLDQVVLMLCCWFSEVASTLRAESHFLSRSFRAVCELQQLKEPHRTQQMIHELNQALDPGPGAVPGMVPQIKPEPGMHSASKLGLLPETEQCSEPETGAESKLGSVPRTKAECVPGSLPGTEEKVKPEPVGESLQQTKLKPEPGSAGGTDANMKLELGTELELRSKSETELTIKPRLKLDPETKIQLKPETEPSVKPKVRAEAGRDPPVFQHERDVTEVRLKTLKDSELSGTRIGTRTDTRSRNRTGTSTRSGGKFRTELGST